LFLAFFPSFFEVIDSFLTLSLNVLFTRHRTGMVWMCSSIFSHVHLRVSTFLPVSFDVSWDSLRRIHLRIELRVSHGFLIVTLSSGLAKGSNPSFSFPATNDCLWESSCYRCILTLFSSADVAVTSPIDRRQPRHGHPDSGVEVTRRLYLFLNLHRSVCCFQF
jgi:hypothetical protein